MSIDTMDEIRYLVEQLAGDSEALRRVRDATVSEIRLREGIRRVAQDLRRGREAPVGPDPIEPLTRRETEVLDLLDTRLATEEIAAMLHIAPEIAKRHMSNLYQKLDVRTRREAIVRAHALRLLPPGTLEAEPPGRLIGYP